MLLPYERAKRHRSEHPHTGASTSSRAVINRWRPVLERLWAYRPAVATPFVTSGDCRCQ